MGNEQQNEGRMEQARGTIKETVGDATNNEKMQREGEYDKAKGNVREGVGDVREGVDNAAKDAGRAADDWQRDK
ncbi:MAG: CsbD family protein [Chloroflexota bacterium]